MTAKLNRTTTLSAQDEKALRDSIRHWTRLEKGISLPGETVGMKDCALCCLHRDEANGKVDGCYNCPIGKMTGLSFCEGTPYEDADKINRKMGKNSPEFKAAAGREVAFLHKVLDFYQKGSVKAETCGNEQNESKAIVDDG